MAAQLAGLAGCIKPFGNAAVRINAKAPAFDAVHPQRGAEFFAQAERAGGEQAPGEVERRRPGGQGHAKAAAVVDSEWAAVEQGVGVGANAAHQGQGVAIGAEQDVLAVVQRPAVDADATRPPAKHAAGFDQGDVGAGGRGLDGGGNARPAATDDGDFQGVSP